MWVIQTTHPEWLGNHPWILPASIVLFLCALLLWLCQYARVQRILGIARAPLNSTPPEPSLSPHAPLPLIQSSRLKIISSYYGVDGGPDEEVSDKYLRPKICDGRSLAWWVGADLFGAFQSITGVKKRLKVQYSFDGKEATVIRQENELLVLPEDPLLKAQADKPPAIELTEIQIKAITLARELRSLANKGSRGCSEGEFNMMRIEYEHTFAPRVNALMFEIARAGGGEDPTLRRFSKAADKASDILNVAGALIRIVGLQDGIDVKNWYPQ